MGCEAVVRPGLNSQANTSGATLLTELDSFWHIAGGMARQGIMQVANEVVSVIQWQ